MLRPSIFYQKCSQASLTIGEYFEAVATFSPEQLFGINSVADTTDWDRLSMLPAVIHWLVSASSTTESHVDPVIKHAQLKELICQYPSYFRCPEFRLFLLREAAGNNDLELCRWLATSASAYIKTKLQLSATDLALPTIAIRQQNLDLLRFSIEDLPKLSQAKFELSKADYQLFEAAAQQGSLPILRYLTENAKRFDARPKAFDISVGLRSACRGLLQSSAPFDSLLPMHGYLAQHLKLTQYTQVLDALLRRRRAIPHLYELAWLLYRQPVDAADVSEDDCQELLRAERFPKTTLELSFFMKHAVPTDLWKHALFSTAFQTAFANGMVHSVTDVNRLLQPSADTLTLRNRRL